MAARKSRFCLSFIVILSAAASLYPPASRAQSTQTPDERRQAMIRLNAEALGLWLQATGPSVRAARDKFVRVADYYESIGERNVAASTLTNAGGISLRLAEFESALNLLERAVRLFREAGDKKLEALTLIYLGDTYDHLGQDNKSLEIYRSISNLADELNDQTVKAQILMRIGRLKHVKDIREAERAYKQALAILQNAGAVQGAVGALSSLANLYYTAKRGAEAKKHAIRSMDLEKSLGDRAGEASSMHLLGLIEWKFEGRPVSAARRFEQALAIARQGDSRGSEAYILSSLQNLWLARGNPGLAIFYGKQAVNRYQAIREGIRRLDVELQRGYLSNKIDVYRRLSDALISQGRYSEAQAVLDLIKDEEFKQITRSGERPTLIPYSQTEADVIAKIENLASLERERAELQKLKIRSAEQDAKLTRLRLDIAAANRAFDQALTAFGREQKSASTRVDEIRGGQELQSALAALAKETDSGVVALYTVLGSETETAGRSRNAKSFGWVILVTERSRKAYPIDVSNLEENVFQFRAALATNRFDPRPLAQEIYNAIFRQTSAKQKRTLEADLAEHLAGAENKTIMWSLDGVLRYIPMAALHDGRQYLVENYRNAVFTKNSFLWLTRDDRSNWNALGLGVSEQRENFTPLPGVKKELETIIREPPRQTGILDGSIRLNDQFKKELFLNTVGDGSFPVVHIASHYGFNPAHQDASFLLVGDGRVSFAEMGENKNLFGGVDLLTLSACDTGVSGNGREAEGFAYLAQSLGAKSVIASLWPVSDAGTPELMIRFYRLKADNPSLTKAETLRRTQLSLLLGDGSGLPADGPGPSEPARQLVQKPDAAPVLPKGPRPRTGTITLSRPLPPFERRPEAPFAHPFYWAPFILIGNWK